MLVFDPEDEPFLPLTDFYHDCSKRIDNSSALSYLQSALPFFSWLVEKSNYQGRRINWNDTPEVIRAGIENYLMTEMECKVREKDSFRFVKLTKKSPNTVNRFLSAIKAFYKSMMLLKFYPYHNPLIDSHSILNEYKQHAEGVRQDKSRMPAAGGTEEHIVHRRLTDSFFKLINEEWQPQIIDDPDLPFHVYQAGKKVNWSHREMVIARILFESGARASEILELTIGDYRSRNSFQEASTFNKGSHGRRIKFVRFSKDTVKRLMHYINTERKSYDPDQLGFDDLPDEAPLFLTELGTPYNYEAWYYHWNEAMKKSDLKLNPHKARHWFVTSRLRVIFETSQSKEEIEQRKHELIIYMKWKNQDTIKVYEHYFNEEKHREAHDAMLEEMKAKEEQYVQKEKIKRKKIPKLTVIENTKENAVDEDLIALFNGLE